MNILKLAKNLKEFTLDEISILAECDVENEVKAMLKDGLIEFKNGFYRYRENDKILFFELNQKPELKIGERIAFKDIVCGYYTSLTVTHRTFLSYRYQFKNNILPYFGEKFLDEITPAMINDFMNFLQMRYSAKTVEHGIKLLGSVLNWAFYEGLMERNPYYGMKQIRQGAM